LVTTLSLRHVPEPPVYCVQKYGGWGALEENDEEVDDMTTPITSQMMIVWLLLTQILVRDMLMLTLRTAVDETE